MYLNFSQIKPDVFGRYEQPTMILKTLSGKTLGVLNDVFNTSLSIRFSEPSELNFSIPKSDKLYSKMVGMKEIHTDNYGVYVIINPEGEQDGIKEILNVKAYSREKLLEYKKFFIEDGTFKLYDPTAPTNTILGRILEASPDWSVGYVAPSVASKYRTFTAYNDFVLSFIYNEMSTKFRCYVVFDTYKKEINIYDKDVEPNLLPIYLDFDNVLKLLTTEEMTQELVTAMEPYGADGLNIRGVNPIGTNWIYDLSYFISNGDIDTELANKWLAWQMLVESRRKEYMALVGIRVSVISEILTLKAQLADLQGELKDLTNQQSVTIQAISLESTQSGKATQQENLNTINSSIRAKKAEIERLQSSITSKEGLIKNSYNERINTITREISLKEYFTNDEQKILNNYFLEKDFTDSTFVATVNSGADNSTIKSINNESINIIGKHDVYMESSISSSKVYPLKGGSISIGNVIGGDIIRGTIERGVGNKVIVSLYMGKTVMNDGVKYDSCMVTLVGESSTFNPQTTTYTDLDEVQITEVGFPLFRMTGSLYISTNASDYQAFSVELELLEHAKKVLHDVATPTYEFSVESANFLFSEEFKPFKDKFKLGDGVYLRLGEDEIIKPRAIEIKIDFESPDSFSIIFSNRFKRFDNVSVVKEMLENSYSSGRKFDASEYLYKKNSDQVGMVSEFMKSSLDAAVNSVIGASNKSVIIDGAGIHVGGESNTHQMRIIDNMIAMTDDNWNTAKMAIGRFATPQGTYWGVNAEVITGKLIAGNNLIIESLDKDGVYNQFKVDGDGVKIRNSTLSMHSDKGGKLLIDPEYGFAAGTSSLFYNTADGGISQPSFIDTNGNVTFDSSGMPKGANFYLSNVDGSAYFKGSLFSTKGKIGGWTIENDILYSGSGMSRVQLNASNESYLGEFAMWAGADNATSAPFRVRRNGELFALNANIAGTLRASTITGNLTGSNGAYINGCGLNIGDGNFVVDTKGNVTLAGNITWGSNNRPEPTAKGMFETIVNNNGYYGYFRGFRRDGDQLQIYADEMQIKYINADNITAGSINADMITVYNLDADRINTGALDAERIGIGGRFGKIAIQNGSTGYSITEGIAMFGPYDDFCIHLTDRGAALKAWRGSAQMGVDRNECWSSGPISIGSDRRIKKDISDDMSMYEDFFMSLKPSHYKMVNSMDDRYHTGFIAQEIEDAIANSGLDNDRNAIVSDIKTDQYDDTKMVAYSEIIPLNTHMIQKLYKRVEELERKIANEK